MLIRTDDWDSQVLGYHVGRADDVYPHHVNQLALWAAADRFDLIHVSGQQPLSTFSEVFSEQGTPIGQLTVLAVDLNRWQQVGSVSRHRQQRVSATHLGAKRIQAERYGFGGRYERDSRIGSNAATLVYQEWITDAANDSERTVLVLDDGDGILVLSHREIARIELIGVRADRRGAGLGYALISAAAEIAVEHGLSVIEVGAYQDNLPAMRLYHRAGFEPSRTSWKYHLWTRNPQ